MPFLSMVRRPAFDTRRLTQRFSLWDDLTVTENLDAWSAYHLGLQHMYRFNRKDNAAAAANVAATTGAP